MLKKTVFFLTLVSMITIVILMTYSANPPSFNVIAQKVQPTILRNAVETVGQVTLRNQVDLSPQIVGQVEDILVEAGDIVNKGDLLIRLDPAQFKAERDRRWIAVQKARNRIKRIGIDYLELEESLQRSRALFNNGVIGEQEFKDNVYRWEHIKIELEQSRLQLASSESALEQSEKDLSHTEIRAPFSGQVTKVWARLGQNTMPSTLNIPGSRLLSMGEGGPLEVTSTVSEYDVIGIKEGQRVEIKIHAMPDRIFKGSVSKIGIQGEKKDELEAARFEITATFDSPREEGIRPGMSSLISIITDSRKVSAAIPIHLAEHGNRKTQVRDIYGSLENRVSVFIVDGNKSYRRVIQLGESFGNHIEVKEGLKPNESIIVGPNLVLKKLEDGSQVNVNNIEHAAQAEGHFNESKF